MEALSTMETELIKIKNDRGAFSEGEEGALQRAGKIIREGGLVAFPTETVYGLGGDALNPGSAKKIYAAKGRPSDNPLIVHICRFRDIYGIADRVPEAAVKLAAAFWPGPLTMILHKSARVPKETTGGLDTVAVRFPSGQAARKLISYGGGYVAAPSANLSGKPSPTAAKYVIEDMWGKIEAIVDGGSAEIGLESTIVDLTVEPPQILRPGYVTREMVEAVLGKVEAEDGCSGPEGMGAPRAPGMKYRHYAPSGMLLIVEGAPERVVEYVNEHADFDRAAGKKTGVIATEEMRGQYGTDVVKCVGSREDEGSIARNLFSVLREFDEEGVARIYSESFASQGLGQAVMNRLLKAAGHHVVRV